MPIVYSEVKLYPEFRIDLLVEAFNDLHIAQVLTY